MRRGAAQGARLPVNERLPMRFERLNPLEQVEGLPVRRSQADGRLKPFLLNLLLSPAGGLSRGVVLFCGLQILQPHGIRHNLTAQNTEFTHTHQPRLCGIPVLLPLGQTPPPADRLHGTAQSVSGRLRFLPDRLRLSRCRLCLRQLRAALHE